HRHDRPAQVDDAAQERDHPRHARDLVDLADLLHLEDVDAVGFGAEAAGKELTARLFGHRGVGFQGERRVHFATSLATRARARSRSRLNGATSCTASSSMASRGMPKITE